MKFVTLAFAGLAAVAMAAIGDVNTKPAGIGYNNDAQATYHCDRDIYITRCAVEGACSTIEECVIRCIDGESGAYCEPVVAVAGGIIETGDNSKKHRSAPNARQVDEAMTVLKARYPVPQENKHRECSNDGASVLLCRFGFCATEYYCKDKKNGSWCHTDCTCCKKGKMGAAEVDDRATGVENTDEETPQVRNDATFRKREADNTIGCQMGSTKCSPSKSLILSCFDGQKYSPSKACGSGCCNDDSIPGRAFCTCGPSPHGLDSPITRHTLATRSDSPTIPQGPVTCIPGSQGCSNGRYVVFCNGLGAWYVVQDCGSLQSCVETPEGSAFCFGQKMTPTDQLEQRDSVNSSPSTEDQKGLEELLSKRASITSSHAKNQKKDVATSHACNPLDEIRCTCPGVYRCYRLTYILVCDGAGHWQTSAECSQYGCKNGPSGSAYCVQPSGASQSDQPEKRDLVDSSPRISGVPVPSFEYAPEDSAQPAGGIYCDIQGVYICIGDDMYVCNSVNSWQLSAHCGETATCVRKFGGVAFCVPKYADEAFNEFQGDARSTMYEPITPALPV